MGEFSTQRKGEKMALEETATASYFMRSARSVTTGKARDFGTGWFMKEFTDDGKYFTIHPQLM